MSLIVYPYTDVFVRYLLGDETGRQYDIEVQIVGNERFTYRSLFYWSKLYSSQLSTGDDYRSLKPAITINLLNFSIIKNHENVHSCFVIAEKDAHLVLTDHLIMHFLELPKFEKSSHFKSSFEKWMAFFKYEGQEEKIMETIIKDDPIIEEAHEKYKSFTQNDELIELYEAKMKWQLQYNTDMADARESGYKEGIEKGIEEGIEKGIEKGARKAAQNVAINMLKQGLDVELISKITDLSADEINRLDN